jgi:hypothetical protein
MTLPAKVLDRIEADFPEGARASIVALLESYGHESYHRESERVLLDILALAKGDRAQVEELVERAKRDFRDIILWAEYPEQSRLDTPEKIEAFETMLRRFGAPWRLPRRGPGSEE